ncbi:hypothetical protein NC661_10060 [Aquibacillus koreensis]|uniref:Uncharacterized protein n=1 Tax=Aquibacillus koreensis TaxID=279446 RepID=A0A9X4AI25_9BACI|nr:hypothetical protein [Aquibacillus koreensis]MCT2534243.1 hypothetical protein [Aquibacillus koreensis]MDC3420712.1 hypothetical protein [Aquibacillus koreensis]
MQRQRGNVLPLLASVGIGAAAYYGIKRKGVKNFAQQMVPFANAMGGQGQQNQNQGQ